MSSKSLDNILEAATYLNFKKPIEDQQYANRLVTESLGDLYIKAVEEKKTNHELSKVFRDNFSEFSQVAKDNLSYKKANSFIDARSMKVYYDSDEQRMKKFETGEDDNKESSQAIQEIFRNAYYADMYGNKNKRNEINIVFTGDQESDYQAGSTNTGGAVVGKREITDKSLERKNEGVTNILEDGLPSDVEDNLSAMRKLQTFFLRNERVNLRELLKNYFRQDTEPDKVIDEPKEILVNLLKDYKSLCGATIEEYIKNRLENRIPVKYYVDLF